MPAAKRRGESHATNTQSNWFVGASWDEDQTQRFMEEGLWELGHDDHERFQRQVRSMQPGDRIAIKSCFVRRKGLPFDNRGEGVAAMRIKAIGTVTRNLNDGRRVRVRWEQVGPPREWYFSVYRQAIHLVEPGDWKKDALLGFAFHGVRDQDIGRFLNAPPWRSKYGGAANRGGEKGRRGTVKQERELTDQDIHPSVPDLDEITRRVGQAGHFPPDLCRQLHLGLWANERRHFAILTGISGSGKTLLAREYGKALTGGQEPYFCVVPVQPGWTDPSFLLGYVNPLKGDSYVRTRFLKLLLNAKSDNPAMPHVAILDEMNLSHTRAIPCTGVECNGDRQ